MSIAISAQINPSRFFSACVLGMAFILGLTALLVISELTGEFDLYGRVIVTISSLIAAAFFIFLDFRSKKSFWIDISGSGQIHIREYIGNVSIQTLNKKKAVQDAEAFFMANGSTIWPGLLLLNLSSDSKKKKFLWIFFDSVREDEFKALYIACQWLTMHKNEKQ